MFQEPGVNVRLEEMIDIKDVGGIADELLIAQLPRPWKNLPKCPARYRDGEVFRGITAEQRTETIIEGQLVRELREWRLALDAWEATGEKESGPSGNQKEEPSE